MAQTVAEGVGTAPGPIFDDLRSFIAAAQEVDDWRLIEGADWDLEIGSLTEATAELLPEPPMLIFDNIKGYPQGYRVVSSFLASARRVALALGLPVDRRKLELVRLAAHKLRSVQPIPPNWVADGPVFEQVFEGGDVDLWKFPVPRFHSGDGGRYLGTGDSLINRDPQSDFVNMGTYRMQVHDSRLLGLWMSPGQQGRQICQRYWERGEACPVVATFGADPTTFMASHNKIPWGHSELDYVGGLRGRPLEVVRGPLTGLPIPAHAEIAIEGEVPPPGEQAHDEGPFGEWPGYYSGGTRGTGEQQPVIRVKALYHRRDPYIVNMAPMWPGAQQFGLRFDAGLLWDQLESAGIQDVVGVWTYPYLVAVSIRQRFAGHAQQAGMAVITCSATARNGRYVVVVDDDIDVTDFKDVLWAMQTRVDPVRDIQTVDRCWSTPLDPRMPPDKRASGDHTNSRAIFYAVRPFEWRDKYPQPSRVERERRNAMVEKYRDLFPFPNRL